ncbi:GTPase activating protein (GAP) for Rho1p [Coemansia sp. BCRC 34301]|nr:GTPase activating protein (GAP) for Rho1p [Coemansia sp. BCRC 34301]
MAQSSTEFAPHASSSPSISAAAASLTAASSFSFRNSQTQFASSHPLPSQSSYSSSSNNRHSTATTTTATNRDSMFLRLKEKMKSFKPRSRPQSDNFADRRSAVGAPHGAGSQPLPSSIVGSPSFNKANRGTTHFGLHKSTDIDICCSASHLGTSSESQLFGMSLSCAVKAAGVHVGSVAESGEACVVPTVVAVCGRHLCEQGQQTQGIFRVNGSMKRVQLLQDEFCERPLYGRHIEWSKYTLHDAATILRRYLISLPESVISAAHYSAFLDKLAESVSDAEKAHDYSLLIGQMTPESRHTLLYMLELLSVFARPENCTRTLMNASNLAAVLQPCLLVHPGHVANPHEYGKAKDVVEFLIEHASELHTSGGLSAGALRDRTDHVDDNPQQQSGGEGFVMVGQGGLNRHGGFGAGLIVNSDNGHARGIASDDGTTLDALTRDSGLTTVHSADSAIPGQQASAHVTVAREKQLVVGSAIYIPVDNLAQQTRSAAESKLDVNGSVPPPSDDSLAIVNLNMSTPAMGTAGSSHGYTVRPLGSVTARLFDPTTAPQPSDDDPHQAMASLQQLRLADVSDDGDTSLSPDMPSAGSPFMGSFTSWPSNRSSMALSSVQYQYTRSPLTPQQLNGSSVHIGERPERDVGSSPRPRRSQSFAVPVRPSEDMPTALSVHARLEPERSRILDQASMTVQTRRGTTGERRAGYVNVTPVATDGTQLKARPLPTIPTEKMARSATDAPLYQGPSGRLHYGSALPASKTMGAEPTTSQPVFSGSNGAFHLYPQPQANRMTSSTAKVAPRSPMVQYKNNTHLAGQAPAESPTQARAAGQPRVVRANLAYHSSPDPSAGRASWLSDDVPEEELEREFMSAAAITADSSTTSANVRVAAGQQCVPYLMDRYSTAQQTKLHPIGRADPMSIAARQQHFSSTPEQGKHSKQQQKSMAGGDKAGMSRLKNIFRIKHSGSGGEEAERTSSKGQTPAPLLSDAFPGGVRQQGSAHSPSLTSKSEAESVSRPFHQTTPAGSRAGGSAYGSSVGGGAFTPAVAIQHGTGVSSREQLSISNSFEVASRIQVVVPAGHLSIVYPDSPMSKTDTLRRASIESLVRRSNGGNASSSGHAYLVDPDQELPEEGEAEMAEGSRYSSRYAIVESGDRPLSSPFGFRGANLHPAASNSTTLHSAGYAQHQHKMYGGGQQQQRTVSGAHSSLSGVNPRSSSMRAGGGIESPLQQQPFQPYHMRVHTPSAFGAVQTAPTSTTGGSSSDQRRLYAMHRLTGSDTHVDDSSYVLPSISNGSPLLSGFEFGSGERSPPGSQQYMTIYGRVRRQSTRRSIVNDSELEEFVEVTGSVASNSPRRSRSLRNTITSLRRKLSRSSRNGAAHSSSPDMSPTGVDDMGQQQQLTE